MARKTSADVARELVRRIPTIAFTDALILARAEKTLHRWAELECGDGNQWLSLAIVRDEVTDKPVMEVHPNAGKTYTYAVADREKGALRRVSAVCTANKLYFFQQTDPRGCALYVSTEPLTDSNYSSIGIAVC